MEDEFEFSKGIFEQAIRVYPGKTAADFKSENNDSSLYGTVLKVEKNVLLVRNNEGKQFKVFRTVADQNRAQYFALKPGDTVGIFYQTGKFFGDKLTEDEQQVYKDSYRDQIWDIMEQVEPLDRSGNGVVQLGTWLNERGGLTQKRPFFFFLDKDWDFTLGETFSEQIWIAQEDLWIQNEIYSVIRKANDSISKFEGIGGKDKDKEYTFTNPNWEVKLKWGGGNTLAATFTNLLRAAAARLQAEGLHRRKLARAADHRSGRIQKETFHPHGDKGDTQSFELDIPNPNIPREGVFAIEQVLTWETAAVRRLEGVYISQEGDGNPEDNREFLTKLLPYNDKANAGAPPPRVVGKEMVAIPGCPRTITSNGFIRERYIQVKPDTHELRTLPVAVVMIVEQGQVDRVQTAFNNSRLRFLTTQVQFRRYPFSVRPQLPRGATGNNAKVAVANEEMEANVELVIYGTVTIYNGIPSGPGMC